MEVFKMGGERGNRRLAIEGSRRNLRERKMERTPRSAADLQPVRRSATASRSLWKLEAILQIVSDNDSQGYVFR